MLIKSFLAFGAGFISFLTPCVLPIIPGYISYITGKKLDEIDKDKISGEYDHMRQFKFDHKDIKAFGILGVSVGLKWKKIQDKFKVLVKKFHPDMNSGNKKYEEKLKLITLAYTQLKNTYRDKIDTKS